VRDLGLELIDIQPEASLGINLHRVEIAQKEPFFGEATADVPQCGPERTAGLGPRPVSPEKVDQPVPGLGVLTMEGEVGQE
jgi:hypothetical protein